ncbi:DUF4382 domain-containing protein [Gillisia sp. Q332]|uniref:DUF4382 domain-containing protein n=1 Tax=Gillisia xinjiangensis TaxID=3384765 RepID=UPI00391CB53C
MYSKKFSVRKITAMLIIAMAVTMFYSCDNDSDAEGKARVKVSMTDAPGDYKNVFIDVQDVKVKSNTSADEEGWVSLSGVEPRIYDLLELTGGVTQMLANSEMEPGTLGQIRLILGPDNTIVLNDEVGTVVNLSAPSTEQSGLKLQVNQELEAGMEYEYLLDFDVDQSIVSAGASGGYILKPVIRLVNLKDTGIIKGEVQPSLSQSVVKAANAANTITAYAAADGKFSLNGVPAGTYQVTVTPAVTSGLAVKVINNVQVSSGASADLEVIFLEDL